MTTVTYKIPGRYAKQYPIIDSYVSDSHILIGGMTGSGKSVLINDIMFTLLAHCSPISANGCQFMLIDPKRVELSKYRNLPHVFSYACELSNVLNELDKAIILMERRYMEMACHDETLYSGSPLYIIIDELADLMVQGKKEMLPRLQRIAQLGRASKIFLICATQAPNREVIPASLTLNFGVRIALHCFSPIESKQVIGCKGAELLPKHGKALVYSANGVEDIDVPFTTPSELVERISFWMNQKPEYKYIPDKKVW